MRGYLHHRAVRLCNAQKFNQQAYALLEVFEQKVIAQLLQSNVVHANETGINIGGKNHWLHCVSSPQWTLYNSNSCPTRDKCLCICKCLLIHTLRPFGKFIVRQQGVDKRQKMSIDKFFVAGFLPGLVV